MSSACLVFSLRNPFQVTNTHRQWGAIHTGMFVHNGSLSARQKFSVKETKRYLRQNYSRFAKPQMGLGWVQGQSVFVIHTWFVAVQSVYQSMCVCVQIFTRRDKCEYISIPHTLSGSIFHQKFSAQSKTSGTAHSEKSCRTKERKPRKLVQIASLKSDVLHFMPFGFFSRIMGWF